MRTLVLILLATLLALVPLGCATPIPAECKWIAKDILDYENAGMPVAQFEDYTDNLKR